jgi:hypothetical protein
MLFTYFKEIPKDMPDLRHIPIIDVTAFGWRAGCHHRQPEREKRGKRCYGASGEDGSAQIVQLWHIVLRPAL